MRSVLASFIAAILVLVIASAEAFSEEIALKPKLTSKAPQQLFAPLISSSNPAVVVYFDEALTARTQCATSGIITAYIVAESFEAPLSSISYTIAQSATLVFLDEEVVTGTATGSARSGINFAFIPPVDASNQLLLERVRYTMSTNCTSGCPTTSRQLVPFYPRAFDENSLEILTTAYGGYVCAQGLGDLIIESFTAPASARLYDDIGSLLSATVKNVGAVTCTTSANFNVAFYLSTDTILTAADTKLTQVSSPLSLPPGQTTTATPSGVARIPLNAPTGNAYLIARADENTAIAEQNENNNTSYRSITIMNPLFDTTYVYAEDFQEGDGGWTPKDRTASEGATRWNHTSYNDGSGDRGVMWCGTSDPSYSKPPGYGNLWSEGIQKTFTISSQSLLTITYMIQHDTEPGYDYVYLQISADGVNFTTVQALTGASSGFEQHEYTTMLGGPTQNVIIRFMVVSDESYSDEDGLYDSDGACRLDWVEVTGHPRDNFDTDSDGWSSGTAPGVGGAFRLVYNPICDPAVPCENMSTGKPMVACNSWVAYDPGVEQFPFASPADTALGRGVDVLIESPTFSVPANAIAYYLEFDVYRSLTRENGVYYYWELSSPAGGVWTNDNYVFYGNDGWMTMKKDITPYVNPTATTLKIRLGAKEMVAWGTSDIHSPGPYFDNVKVFAVEVAASGPGVDIGGFPRACTASDTDWDGVGNLTDACPTQNSSNFDRDADGCIESPIGARHIEYLAKDTLKYYINETGAPGIGDGSDLAAVQSGVRAWNGLSGTDMAVEYLGTTAQKDARALDGVNIITFSDPDYVFPAGVLGVGITTSYTEPGHYANSRPVLPGQIVDCDIMFNPLVAFKTPTAGSGTDLRSVATHEAGHLFGLSHSAVKTSTMFYVLPADTQAASLELEDRLAMFKAYPDSAALANASHLEGTVTDGRTSAAVPGAIVFAINAASGDTLGSEYTLLDGTFAFVGLPNGDYYVSIYPLNGSSVIGYLQPGNINQLILDHAVTVFVPEYYDAAESGTDNPADKVAVNVQGGTAATIAIVTNIDEVGPTVAETSPPPDESAVGIDASILVSFSEPIDLGSVRGHFKLTETASGEFVRGNAALVDDDSTLAFIPSLGFGFETEYELELGTGITDKFGNGLASPYIIHFTTEPKPDVAISSLAPRKGVEGAVVVVSGFGFEDNPADNIVDFNGTQAAILESSPTRLLITVPPGAATGNVTVTNTVEGKTSNAIQFTVLHGEEVARGYEVGRSALGSMPRSIALLPDGNIAFVATDAGYSAVVVDPGRSDYLANHAFTVPGGIDEIDATPDGKRVYAVSGGNHKFYRIHAETGSGGLSDLTILNEVDIGAAPLGITIEPSGRRAFVATADNEVQIWDISTRSATFERQIGTIDSVGTSLRGKMATDPAGQMLLVLSGAGSLLVYDLAGDSLTADIETGLDPRDVVVDPMGKRAYVTDGNGAVAIVALDLLSKVIDVSTGGSLRGAAITPAGSFLYAVNRELNFYDVVDLRAESETYRSIAANVALPVNPVDAVLAPDGLYAYSIVEYAKCLVATAIGVGPAIQTLSPVAGRAGTRVVLAGSGFAADASLVVSFDGVEVTPDVRRDSMLVVTVPSTAKSGPVTAIGRTPLKPTALSNEIFFNVLGATASDDLRLAATLSADGLSPAGSAAVAPTGVRVVFATESAGSCVLRILDTDPTSSTFHKILGETNLGTAIMIDDIAITADGRRAIALDHGAGGSGSASYLPIIDISPQSGQFATVIDSIDVSALTEGVSSIALSPNSAACALAEYGNPGNSLEASVHLIDIGTAPERVGTVLGTAPIASGTIGALAYHPMGLYCYVAVEHETEAAIHVLDVDPESVSFMTVVASLAIPGSSPKPSPKSISFTPNGQRCLVLVADPGSAERRVITLNTSNPANPAISRLDSFAATAEGTNLISVSPRGDRALLSYEGTGLIHLRIFTDPDSLGIVDTEAPGITAGGAGYVSDASRFYAAVPAEGAIRVYDFSTAQTLAVISGNGQSGIVNQTLPAPLRVQATTGGGQGVSGIPVTFTVTAGGGRFTGNGTVTQVVATNSTGAAHVSWILGPDTGTQSVEAAANGLSGSPLAFTAAGLADPAFLPLELVDAVPLNSATVISTTTAAQLTFSRVVDLSTVDSTTVFLREQATAVAVSAVIGATDGNRKISLTPRTPLKASTTYLIETTAGIRDLSGGPLQNPQSTLFTTAYPPALILQAASPPSGLRGVNIVLSGRGFDAAAANNTVLFNAAQAGVTEAAEDHLDIVVPYDALKGASHVQVQIGERVSNSLTFRVLAPETSAIDKDVIRNVGTGSSTRSVAVTPDGARLYAVSPLANLIVPIDIRSFWMLPVIPVGQNPHSIKIHPRGTPAYVTNFLDNTVSVIETNPVSSNFNKVIETISVGQNPLDVLLTPDGDRLIVSNVGSRDLTIIDSDEYSATFHRVLATVATGTSTKSIAVTPDGGRLYVATRDGYIVIDLVDYGVVRSVATGSSTKSMAVTPDGAYLILLTTDGQVMIYDIIPESATMDQVVGTVNTGSSTKSIAVTPDGGMMYLIQERGDVILAVRLGTIPSAGVIGAGGEAARTLITATIVDSLFAGEDPAEMTFSPDGRPIAVITNSGDNTISVIDPSNIPVAVTLSAFEAKQEGRGAKLTWATLAEQDITGFNILRSEGASGAYEPVTPKPIPAQGRPGSYEYLDESLRPLTRYFYRIEALAGSGKRQTFGPVEFTYLVRFALEQNVPNPFNPLTRIRFTLPEAGQAKLVIYDVLGRQVRTLLNRRLAADHYEVFWNGKNNGGVDVATGVYFYRLEACRLKATKKMVLLR